MEQEIDELESEDWVRGDINNHDMAENFHFNLALNDELVRSSWIHPNEREVDSDALGLIDRIRCINYNPHVLFFSRYFCQNNEIIIHLTNSNCLSAQSFEIIDVSKVNIDTVK